MIARGLTAFGAGFVAAYLFTAIVIAPLAAQEPEPAKTLSPGIGVEVTTARCVTCHDAQHITRAKLSRDEWAYNIKNMIERGAPIAPEEIPQILEYLATYYNRDSAPPPPDATVVVSDTQEPVKKLLTANACVACHQLERRTVGPSFLEVAEKFAGDSTAAQKLVKKIREGGAGNWGNVPMPPNPGLADIELSRIVDWILAQSPR